MTSAELTSFLVVHPSGNTYVRQDLQTLHEAGRLWRYLTAVGYSRDSMRAKLNDEMARRSYDLPKELISTKPCREIVRLLAPRFGANWLTRHETGWASMDAVFEQLDLAAAKQITEANRTSPRKQAALVYEDGALHTLAATRAAGWLGVYHLPIAYGPYARQIFRDEAVRLPEWAPTLQGDRDSPAKMARKERELELADVVICPSQFVIDSLPRIIRATKPCHLVPYGAPTPSPTLSPDPRDQNTKRPLRLLFVGALSQRKGLADLFAAIKLLGNPQDIELVLLGRPSAPREFYNAQGITFSYEEPRANDAVLTMMETCDALVLPSLVEGRAIVQLEALSRGLPLIITPNTGGDDLITPGETGFIVPIRSPAAIAEKIAWLRDHRAELPAMREACRARARLTSWDAYRRRLLNVLTPDCS